MSKRYRFEFEDTVEIFDIEYPVTVRGTGYLGSKDTLEQPGDKPEGDVESVYIDLPVSVNGKDVMLDIIGMIPKNMIDSWEEDLLERARENEQEKKDRHDD